MLLDKKQEARIAKRKGLTIRTTIVLVWLILSCALGYLLVSWLFSSGTLTLELFYQKLSFPTSISENVLRLGLVAVFVIVMQFFILIGFALSSPAARERPGKPTVHSRNPDLDGSYLYR
jgi:uncharacterized BrkB/YihY/UPF0761 family membrane protein